MMKRGYIVCLCLFLFSGLKAQRLTSEDMFKDYFTAHKDSLDEIEGIWTVSGTQEFYRYDTLYDVIKISKAAKVAVIKKEDRFESYNLTGDSYDAQFFRTETKGVYFYTITFPETQEHSKTDAVINKEGSMEYKYEFPDKYLRFKLADTYEEGTFVTNAVTWNKVFPEQPKKKK
jgi:hypothetical protein